MTSTGLSPLHGLSSVCRRIAAPLLVPSLLLILAGGCSSTAIQSDDGAAGGTGSGGVGSGGSTSGGGGTGGSADGDPCSALVTAYAAAFQNALSCNPSLSNVQCQHLASPSLLCPICLLHVNDTTVLDQIRAQYDAATQCPRVPCPAIACKQPAGGACVPSDSGGALGTCLSTP